MLVLKKKSHNKEDCFQWQHYLIHETCVSVYPISNKVNKASITDQNNTLNQYSMFIYLFVSIYVIKGIMQSHDAKPFCFLVVLLVFILYSKVWGKIFSYFSYAHKGCIYLNKNQETHIYI